MRISLSTSKVFAKAFLSQAFWRLIHHPSSPIQGDHFSKAFFVVDLFITLSVSF